MGDGKKLSPRAQAELDALNKSTQQAPESNVPAGDTQPQNVKKKSEPVAGESTLFPSQINQGQGDQLSPSDGQVPFSGSQPNLGQGATNPPVITEQMKAQAGYGVLSPQQLQKQAAPVKYTKTADKYNEAGVPFALIKANPLVQDEKQESDYNKQMNMQSDLIGQGAPTYNWSAANMVSPVVPLDQSVLSPTTGAALDKITQSSPVIAEKSRKDLYRKNLDEVFENPYSEKDNMSIALGAYDQYLSSIGEYQYESEKMASLQADLAKETPGTEAYNSKLIEIQKMQYQKSTNALAYYGEYINERAAKAEGDLNVYYGDDIALLGTLTERANKLQADGMTDSQEYADIVGQINTINQKPGFVNLVGEYDMYSTMYNQTYDAYSNSITEFPELKAKIERDAVNQELVDLAYQGKISTPGQDFVSLSVNNQVGRSVTNLIAGLAYVPKQISGAIGFGETYDWTDKFFDSISGGLEDVNNNFLPTPSGDVNKGITLANVVRGFSDLAIMAGIATTTAGAGIPVAAGTVAAGVVMTNSEAYKEGIAAGMSNTDSENFAMSLSVTAGVLEMINPEAALFRKSAIKAGAKEFIEAFATGTTKKAAMANAVKKVFKPTLKNIVGENVQEFTQGLADNLVRLSFQKETGADLKAFNDYGQEVVDTILLTSIISTPFGVVGAKTEASTLQRGAMMSAALDPVKYNQVVADMLRQGKVSAYRAEQLKETIGLAAEANKRIPEDIAEEKRPDVLVEMMKKVKQEQVVKNADAAFKAQEEAKLKAQEAIVQQTAGIVTEQKEAEPEAQVALTPQEETEYENLLAREMTSFSGDKLSQQETIRLQELKNKLTPTQDATQERIITEDNQQQYQGAQEERQDTGAGRSNIIDEGGQVQQEKVLSSQVAPAAEVITATPQALEEKRKQTEEKIKRKDLFIGVGEFSSELGGSDKPAIAISHREKNGIEFVEYAHPETGSVDVIVTGTSGNDFVGFYRIYENGKPTNKWSSKFENQSRNKENFKTMLGGVQEMLPQGHEYTEKTSISTDGLRVWAQQLGKGYELQYDENGKLKTNLVAINGDAIVNELGVPVEKGQFENIKVKTKEDFEIVKKALLPYLEKLGLNESNVKWLTGTVKIDLPILKSTAQQKAKTTPQSQEKVLSSEVTPATEAVAAINQALKSANIVAEEITEEQAVGLGIKGDGAFLSKDGKIYIVPSRVEKGWGATVVWHEGVHPVLNIINNTDKATYDAMVNGVKEIAKQNESVASVVQWANENYSDKGENRVNDEIATETIARIANGDIDVQTLPTAFKQRVIDFINKIASALGIDPILADTDVETFKKKAKQISDTLKSGRDIAEIVGEENVGMFEDVIVDENGNEFDSSRQLRASFSDPKTKTQFVYMKDSKKFNDLKSQGFITEDKFLSEYNGMSAVLHSPDAMFSGLIIKDGVTLIEGKGGIWYPINFHDLSRVWASTSKGAAVLVNRLNESAKANNGKALMVLTSVKEDKLLSNTTAAIGVVDMFLNKLSDKKFGLKKPDVKNALINAAKASSVTKIKKEDGTIVEKTVSLNVKGLSKSMTAEDIANKIKDKLSPENSDFADRKFFVKEFISGIIETLSPKAHQALGDFFSVGIMNEGYKQQGKKDYKLSATNLTQSISNMLQEPLLAKDKETDLAYAVIEVDVTPDKDGNYFKAIDTDPRKEHEAYPKAIVPAVSKGAKIVVNALQDRGSVYDSFETEDGQKITKGEGGNRLKVYPTSGLSVKPIIINAPSMQESAGRRLFSEPVEDIARVSELYKNRKGITTGPGEKITTVDTEEAKRRADAFEQMQNTPNDPQVKAAYQAMATETIDQFDELTKAGYAVEIYEGEGEPYANSQGMLDDLRNNKHLFVLSTEKDFGQNKITDQQRNDNPLLRDSGRKDINGKSLLINDVFRFVHDAFGHGERGNSFGPIGEENAWDVHVRMYSPLAARAMTTETRGQNSWVNFGPHMRNEDGSIKSVPMKDRPFAEQKIGLLPEWVSSMQESKAKRGTKGDLLKDTYYSHGLTEDKGDYIFFHVSSADKKSVLKGIDSRKFYSTRTAREEKGLQYGVASYYTKPTDGETMVGGDKYVVRVPKDKVYPMDTDPNGYRTKAESSTPSNTPFRSEAISRKVAEAAKADGYLMAVGEWNYSRVGEKVSLPEFRADALVPLKPTQEDANSFKANESKKGFKKIEHPEAANIKKLNKTTSLAKKVMDFFSEKGDFGDRYQIASNHAIYEEPITDSDIKEMVKGTSKAIRNEAAALMQESLGERGPKPTVSIKEYNEILSSVDKIKDIKIPGAVNAKAAAIIEDINNALDYGSIDENQAKELRTMLSESSSKARALGIEEFNTAVDSAFASAKQAINTKLEQLGLKTKTPEGMTVAKNSMLDVDALMDLAATMTKKAYAAGVSVDAALKQTMSFIKSTPRYTRLMSNNLITDQEIESIISGEYDRLVMEAERTKRKEKVGTRFQDSPNVSDEIKKAAEEQGFGYVVRNINASWEEAKFIVDFHDQAGELDALIDTMTSSQNKDITDPTRASILAAITDNLLKKAESEQDANVKAGIYKKLQAVVEEGSAMARKAGQTAKIAGELFKRVFGKSVEGTTMMVEEKMRDQIDKIIDRQVPLLRDVIDAIEEANDTKKTKSIVSSLLTDLDAQGVDALTKAINDRLDQGQSITTAFLKSEYKNLLVSQNINDTVKGQIKDLVEKTKLYDEAQAALRTTIKEYNDAKDAATASGTPMTAAQASSYQKQMVAAFIAVNKAQQQAAQANNTLAVYYSDPKNFYKTFATLMQLKLLTAQSFIVNVFSNIVTVPFRLASVAGASMLDYVLTKSAEVITGEKQARRVMLGPQVSAVFNKKNKVIMDALGDIIAKGTTPESVSTLDSKHSLNWNRSAKELTGKIATAMQHKDFESRLSTFFEATFGITADVAARLLALGDVPFKKLAEFGKLEEIGRRKGLKDADLTAFVLDPDEESAKIAKDFGLKVTYQDENIAAEFINSASSYIDKFANEKGAFGYHVAGVMHIMKTAVVPFVKTPLNLLWDTLGYVSPHYSLAQGMVSLANANKARKKGETARMQEHIGEFEKSMAKAGVAMAISIIVKALAEAGGLTGDDQDEKIKSMSYSGEAPPQRSMNMSMLMDMLMGKYNPEKERDPSLDVWINYDKLGVLGLAIGTQALVYSEKSKKEIQDMSILVEMTKVVGMPAMKTVMSQSFMKGAFEVMKVVMDGSSEKSFNRYMQATTTAVSSAIYSNTLATLSKATDKYLANTSATENLGESLKLTFKSRLFMGDEIPSRVNIWGDKQPASPVGTNKYAWYFLNATKAKTVDASKATYKVWELYQSTLDKDVLPSPPSRSITVKKESIDLAPDEYERYQIYVGKTRRALTESYILRGNFDNNNNETRAKVLKSSYDKGQEFGKAMFILSTPRLYEMYGYTPKAAKAELDMMQAQLDQAQKK